MRFRFFLSTLLILLSGCAAIPSAGPIQVIINPDIQSEFSAVRVIAKPPTPKMNSVQIAAGFVAANISPFEDFGVARKYLTSQASSSWNPTKFDVLDSASIQYNDLGTGVVEISALQIGKLNSNHRFKIFPVAKPFLIQLNIENIPSGLRISNELSSGILTSSDMVRGYSAYNVYFGNENFSNLVSEIVWLPKNEKSLATKITNSLLSGSKESFRTAIPKGTELKFGSVTISNGTAVVNLNASALLADNAQRKFMLAQFVWTLQEIPGIGRIQIASNDRVISTQGKTTLNRRDFSNLDPDKPQSANRIYTLRNGTLAKNLTGSKTRLGRLPKASQISVSSDEKEIAFLNGDQLQIAPVLNIKQAEIVSAGVSRVSFDKQGRLWFTANSGKLYCRLKDGNLQEVLEVQKQRIADFAISPDSGRIALIIANKTDAKLLVGSIVSENGILNVVKQRRIEQSFTEVRDVDWLSSVELVAIGKVGLSKSITVAIPLANGSLRTLNAPKPFEYLITSNDGNILAGTKSNNLWLFQDGIWSWIGANLTAVFSK